MKYLLFKTVPDYRVNPWLFYFSEMFKENGLLRKYLAKVPLNEKDLSLDVIEFVFRRKDESLGRGYDNVIVFLDCVGSLSLEKETEELFREREFTHDLEKIVVYEKKNKISNVVIPDFSLRKIEDRAILDVVADLVPDPSWGGNKVVYSDMPGKEIIVVDGAEEFWNRNEEC